MSLSPGSRLGTYEILSLLGAGGMGEVYAARDTGLGRTVALKVLPADVAHDAARLARLEREARAVAALNDPTIVTLFALERHEDQPFLVMELVEGRSLATLVRPGGLDFDTLLRIALPVAQALTVAHHKGIVHRDLKPANIMVTDDGRVKVLDFGLARMEPPARTTVRAAVSATRTAEGLVVGTLAYMSPEQVRGEHADERSDIFSFGATLYEMATGRPPFGGSGSADILSAVLRDQPMPLERLRPELPPRFCRLVSRCLAKVPADRVQSAVDLCHEIEDLRAEYPASAVTGLTWWPRAAALAAAVALALAATFVAIRLKPSVSPAPGSTIQSIAVLPFDNLMRDPSQDYFVDGMHDALITELARLGVVRVTSRSSVMRYRGKPPESLQQAARELGVDALVEGSVLHAGGRVRVSAQLVLGSSDKHVWAQSYDRDVQDVLVLLDDVSRAIATEIGARVAGQPAEARDIPAVRPEAYDAWLRGRAVVHGLTSPADYWRARESFQQAVEIDPGFAHAWSNLAGTSFALLFFGLAPPEQMLADSREAAARAIALDPREGAGYAVLGQIALYFDWDFTRAKDLLEKAVALDPHSFAARHGYADYLMVTGRLIDSAEQTRIAYANQPDTPMTHVVAATHANAARDYDEAMARARAALSRFPALPGRHLHAVMGEALWAQGRERDALAEYAAAYGTPSERAVQQDVSRVEPRRALHGLAERLAGALPDGPADAIGVAALYAEAGDADAVFRLLDRAYAARTPQLLHVVALPAFDSVRQDRRYVDLIRRIGIPLAISPPRPGG